MIDTATLWNGPMCQLLSTLLLGKIFFEPQALASLEKFQSLRSAVTCVGAELPGSPFSSFTLQHHLHCLAA